MSFGNSNMAGSVLGATFPLLLLASIIQGFQNGMTLRYEEAVVGQNITLSCSIKMTDLKITSMEWSRKNGEKLAVHSFDHGENVQPNVKLQVKIDEENQTAFFNLHLPKLRKQDSGNYLCDISTFPKGTFRSEIELRIEDDITIECNVQNAVQVSNGENVTIDCNASSPDAQFRWTKNATVVSDNESLKLWMVTDANAGIYTLTVNRGKKTLHKEFRINVLPASTSSGTEIVTVPSQHQTETTIRNPETTKTTMMTNNPSTISVTTALKDPSTTSTNAPYTTVTSSLAVINHLFNTTTPSYGRRTTQEITRTRTERYRPTPHTENMTSTRPEESGSFGNVSDKSENPAATPTVSNGSETTVNGEHVTANEDAEQGHLWLLLIIVPLLLLIAVAGILYRKQVIKSRMALPPPFKPPPPPVKYTAPRRIETSAQPFYT